MKINAINTKVNSYKLGFKSIRQDKELISQLKTGERPILENNKQNILAALNNMSTVTDKESIGFLLDVAENLAYGQRGNSKFREILDKEAITPSERENVDWNKLLEDTIYKALKSSEEKDLGDLESDYYYIFGKQQDLTPVQEKLLEYRNSLTNYVVSDSVLENSEELTQVTNIRKNIDYFIASSEIPESEKESCMEKLVYFMSDEYEITPQLKDKKIQVLDEILNDLVVKTPDDDILKTKDIDQRQTGMCAAISICRKELAYENKSRFVEIIMDELSSKDTMSVYDVTELEKGIKIDVPKINIDYDTALRKGYRIIDASAHQWMQNAHYSGDGSIATENYTAFDDENYGIFNDSSWYVGLDEEFSAEKALFKALIKEREAVKSVENFKKKAADAQSNIQKIKKDVIKNQSVANGRLYSDLKSIFPELKDEKISSLMSGLISFYTGKSDDNEVNIAPQLPNEVKAKLLSSYIEKNVDSVTPEQKDKLKNKETDIFQMVSLYVSEDKKLEKLNKFNSKTYKFDYAKKLYRLAAAHRLAVEADVNMPNGVMRFEQESGLPPRTTQIINYLNDIKNKLDSASITNKYSNKTGLTSKKEIETAIDSDILQIGTVIPAGIDQITNTLLGKNLKELTISMYDSFYDLISKGDIDTLNNVSMTMGLKKDKSDVLAYLKKVSEKLSSSSSSNKDLQEAIRILGFENEIAFAAVILSNFVTSITSSGISTEEFERFKKKFGGEDKIIDGIEQQRQQFIKLQEKYLSILQKWDVPSSRANILERMEKSNSVLSREKLNILKKYFDSVEVGKLKNEKIKNLENRKKENLKLYVIPEEEQIILNKIDKAFSGMKKYSKIEYSSINDYLHDVLEKQYNDIGRLTGQFWIREEGSSGLFTAEQIRIFEQMTGKPYQAIKDIEDAAEKIKNGKEGGILTISVDDNDYGFHAQYLPFVSTEKFIDYLTGEEKEKQIVWTDNSWGKVEKENYWNGYDNHYYTDYNQGLGWKHGFLINSQYNIGLNTEDIKTGQGYVEEDDDKFKLYGDNITSGLPTDTYKKLHKLFNYIISAKDYEELLKEFEECIIKGNKVNIKELEGWDEVAELHTENLFKRLEKEIKSEEDFNKLPEDDVLVILFKKIALYHSTENENLSEKVLMADTNQELDDVFNEIFQNHINMMGDIVAKSDGTIEILGNYLYDDFSKLFSELNDKFKVKVSENKKAYLFNKIFNDSKAIKNYNGKLSELSKYFNSQLEKFVPKHIKNEEAAQYFITTASDMIEKAIDERIRIKSLNEPILVESVLYNEFIAAIDKYLKPVSDEELLLLIQQLQEADYEEANKFFDILTPEDAGIKLKKPYDYVIKCLNYDQGVYKTFCDAIANSVISEGINFSEDDEPDTPDELYRTLYIKLSELNVQKFIKSFKAEMLQKYKVRPGFPSAIILSDDNLSKTAVNILDTVKQVTDSIKSTQYIIDLISSYENFEHDFNSTEIYKSLNLRKDIDVEENKDLINNAVAELQNLYEISQDDTTLTDFNKNLTELIKLLQSSDSVIDGKQAGRLFKEVKSLFKDFKDSSVTLNSQVQYKKEQLRELKDNIKLAVDVNIESKYRNDAMQYLNKIIQLYATDASNEEIQEMEDSFIGMFIDRHIVKNPTEILKDCTELLMEGKQDTSQYNILKTYLLDALRVAAQTKIQYKLVQNQHLAIGSKLKIMLPLFNVKLNDGTSESMDSEQGMLYIVEQLSNTSDNYTSLKLFLEQSGLSKQALNALLNSIDFEKINEVIDTTIDLVESKVSEVSQLSDVINEFFSKSMIKYSSLDDFMKNLSTFVKRKLPDWKKVEYYNQFIDYVDNLQYNTVAGQFNNNMIVAFAQSLVNDAFVNISSDINSKLEYIHSINYVLEERGELIAAIDVPDDSDEFKNREEFFEKARTVLDELAVKEDNLNRLIADSGLIVEEE